MSLKRDTELAYRDEYESDKPTKLFDVTCVVGTVYHDPYSTINPTEAAFLLIAQHDAPGVYSFPMDDTRIIMVTVDHVSNGS